MPSPAALFLLFGAFAGSACVTALLVPLVIRLAKARGWVDRPGGRRIHERPVPRVGGLAILGGLLVGSSCYGLVRGWDSFLLVFGKQELIGLFAPCCLVFLVGLLDDLRSLSPTPRLLVEALAAVFAMQAGYLIDVVATPWGEPLVLGPLAYPVTLLWFVGVTNAFNLIDGLDGLLPSVGLVALLGCAAVGLYGKMIGTPALALAVAGALAGFLPWNWRPARIFLGDSGSLLVGFTVAAMSLKVSGNPNRTLAFHVPLLLTALPLAETGLTIARRYIAGQSLFAADRSHIHHVLLEKGLSVPRSVGLLAATSALFAGAALLSRFWRREGVLLVVLVLLVLGVFGLRYLGYVELRVLVHRLKQALRRVRKGLPDLLAVARAGDLVSAAESLDELEAGLRQATAVAGFSYLAVVFEAETAARLGLETRPELHNEEARRYQETLDGAPHWLFSSEQPPEAARSASVCFDVPVPPGSGRYGRLVCQRHHDTARGAPLALDVHRYLAEPLGRILRDLEEARPGHSGAPAG